MANTRYRKIFVIISMEKGNQLENTTENRSTSYDTEPPDDDECRRVALLRVPFAERIKTVRGPCCEKDKILAATSCNHIARNPYFDQ